MEISGGPGRAAVRRPLDWLVVARASYGDENERMEMQRFKLWRRWMYAWTHRRKMPLLWAAYGQSKTNRIHVLLERQHDLWLWKEFSEQGLSATTVEISGGDRSFPFSRGLFENLPAIFRPLNYVVSIRALATNNWARNLELPTDPKCLYPPFGPLRKWTDFSERRSCFRKRCDSFEVGQPYDFQSSSKNGTEI